MVRGRWVVWHGILFEEPNPTGSRPSDLIGLCKEHMQPHPPNTHKGGQGESTKVIEATRRRQRATRRRQREERRTISKDRDATRTRGVKPHAMTPMFITVWERD